MRNLAALSTAVLSVVASPMFATVQVHQLQPSLTSPRPVGTTVVWTATASDSNPGPLVYQFSAGMDGQLHVLRDYALSNTFSFTPVMQEGVYEVQVIARDPKTGESATLTANFTARSRVLFGQPAVNATPNPLVALYSAPSCPAGSDMAILFFQRGTTDYERTDWRACNANASNNFYIAGLRAATTYEMVYQVRTGTSIARGPRALSFRTGTPTETFPAITLPIPATSQADPAEKMVLHSFVPSSAPIATDRAGRLHPSELALIREGQVVPEDHAPKVPLAEVLSHPQAWAFVVGKSLTDPVWWFFLIWLPDYFNQTRGLNIKESWPHLVTIYSIVTVLSIIGGWAPGALVRLGWTPNRARKISMLVAACCVIPILAATHVGNWTAVVLIGLAGAAHQAWSANLYSTVSDMFPKRVVASLTGFGSMFGAGVSMLPPILTGMLLDHFTKIGNVTGGYAILFGICSFAYVIAYVAMHVLAPRFEPVPLRKEQTVL